jgi:predicted XRE-type DNA-binding protein
LVSCLSIYGGDLCFRDCRVRRGSILGGPSRSRGRKSVVDIPQNDPNLIETKLKRANEDYEEWEKREPETSATPSNGNVFTDLGFAEPKEELAKAQLASHIQRIIRRGRLTQVAAAALMGIDQPKVSALLNGRLASFSTDRLLRLLTALGKDVEIVVKERAGNLDKGRISVVGEARETG